MGWALVTARIIVEIYLMVLFSSIPLSSRYDLSSNLSTIGLDEGVLVLDLFGDFLCYFLLFRRVVEDSASILCAPVRSLSVNRSWVV